MRIPRIPLTSRPALAVVALGLEIVVASTAQPDVPSGPASTARPSDDVVAFDERARSARLAARRRVLTSSAVARRDLPRDRRRDVLRIPGPCALPRPRCREL